MMLETLIKHGRPGDHPMASAGYQTKEETLPLPTMGELLDPEEEARKLAAITGKYYLRLLTAVHEAMIAAVPPLSSWEIEDEATTAMLKASMASAVRMTDITLRDINFTLADAHREGLSVDDTAKLIDGLYTEHWRSRSQTIARTETGMASLKATQNRYEMSGVVAEQEILDGDSDGPCKERNGKRVPVTEKVELNHPNCVVAVAPILKPEEDFTLPGSVYPDHTYDQWNPLYESWRNGLMPKEGEAILRYKGNTFEEINGYLRTGRLGRFYDESEIEEFITHLDTALAKSTIPSNVTLYRSADASSLSDLFRQGKLAPGTIVDDLAFQSTSLRRTLAERWGGGSTGVCFKIHVPAGEHGALIGSTEESEVLLPRDTTYRVIRTWTEKSSVGHLTMGGNWKYDDIRWVEVEVAQ